MEEPAIRDYPNPEALKKYTKDYQAFHEANAKKLSGKLPQFQIDGIVQLVEQVKPKRLLDYGSGKGYQYLTARVHEKWGGLLPYCYDPGVIQLARRLGGKFDGVICLDVLEHIAEGDIDDVISDVFAYTEERAFVYFHVCCRLAGKHFPDGRNLHLTVKPPEWWEAKIQKYKRPGLTIKRTYETAKRDPDKDKGPVLFCPDDMS